MTGRGWTVAGAALLAAFVASRACLVAASYDRVANWEEPAFLYGGVALGERGLAVLFDYQDDLSHGGSIPLTVAAAIWVRMVGTRLDVLKGIAVLWSSATLLALLLVAARFTSARAGLLAGLFYSTASASAAMLQVTLVGSHPESVLFMTLALGAYLRTLEHDVGPRHSLLLGLACGAATWCSYLTAPLTAVLGVSHVLRRPRLLPAATAGAVLGFSPWIVQNLILRPHGALQWKARTAYAHAPDDTQWSIWAELATSFGGDSRSGATVLFVLLAFGAWALLASLVPSRRGQRATAETPFAILPIACAAALSLAALATAKPQAIPGEGFYYFRYFAPIQLLLFWLAAIGAEDLFEHANLYVWSAVAALFVAIWVLTQLPLYTGPNTYVADLRRDLESGCAVFGHAEVERAASDPKAVSQLLSITDPGCRRAAFGGYGWGIVSRYARAGNGALLSEALDAIPEATLRRGACDSARRLLSNLYEGAMSPDRRRTGALYLDGACASVAGAKD